MKSSISWLDSEQHIILVDSVGMWNATTLLSDVQNVLAENPQYIIWNPTHVMFPAEHIEISNEENPDRILFLELMAEALLSGKLKLLVIIRTERLNSFQIIEDAYNRSEVGHLVKFVKSLDIAQELIAEHQADCD